MKKIVSLVLALILCGAMCLSLVSCGETEIKVNPDKEHYVVGICQLVQHGALDDATRGFKDALTEALTEAGRTVEFLEQNAQGDSTTCSTIVNSFVSSDVDLILGNATAALQAAYTATETIPVLGTSITEYGVALGLTDFNGVVGNNVSGTSDLAPLETQAQMMIDILALEAGAKIGLVYCSAEPNSTYQVTVVKNYLEDLGYECEEYKFADSNELATIVERAANDSDAIYVPTDNTVANNAEAINNIALPAKTPIFAGESGICSGCGVATLSIDYYDLGYQTGLMAYEILVNGADPATMEIQFAPKVTKMFNETNAKELNVAIPDDYEAIATE